MDFKTRIKTIYGASALLTLISTLLLTLSFVLSFDEMNGYFEGGILPILFWISFILGIALAFASAFLLQKDKIIKTDNSVGKVRTVYVILAVLLALFLLLFKLSSKSVYFTIAIFGACFFMLFIALCVSSGYQYSHIKAGALLLSVLFPILINTENNIVMSRHSNSIENTLTSFFVIAFLIYILYEGKRIFTGEHSRWHLASMLLASHIGLALSVSYVVAYGLGAVNERSRLYQILLILIISLFIETELVRFTKQSEARAKEEWDALKTPEQESTEEKITE